MADSLFSILIPTWNNLPFLKLCIESIRKNSRYKHQIIVHINEGSDGTLEWVRQQNIDYTFTPQNAGVCIAMNMMRTKVKTEYIYFVNDDMYLLPDWDVALYDEIKKLGDDNKFYISSSTIQPKHEPVGVGSLADYGDTVENFRENDLLNDYKNYYINDWKGSTWPPCLVHRDIWDTVGGYSIELTPGMGSDPDFTAKLYFIGVRYFKGLGNSLAYHFEQKSTKVVKKNHYLSQFLFKWGIPNSTLRKYITKVGEPWDENTTIPNKRIKKDIYRGWVKALVYTIRRKYGTLRNWAE
jgi:glycosyltransferase involved in cell wall biosynthesis